jgi:hypothetical protein
MGNPLLEGAEAAAFEAERQAFLNGPAADTGVNDIDLWIGGLAERQMPFGGMLGSTFGFVFETQLEALQNGDRFYYLARLAGLNFLTEMENNSFAKLVMRHTDTFHLPADIFSTPGWILEVDQSRQHTGLGLDGNDDPTEGGTALLPLVIRDERRPHRQHRRRHPVGRWRQRQAGGRRRQRQHRRRRRRRHHLRQRRGRRPQGKRGERRHPRRSRRKPDPRR